MAETSIEWVKNPDGTQGRTWNPIRGCTRVSPGCGGPGPHGGCYAEGIAARFSGPGQPFEGIAEMRGGKGRWTGKLAFVNATLTEPLRVRKPTTWFVNSMSDLFHEAVPDEWIDHVFAVMALCPQHTFQVLTKRSARMREVLTAVKRPGLPEHVSGVLARMTADGHISAAQANAASRQPTTCLPNVWLGVSTEDQRRADERIPDLRATPAAVRFVSAEPLLSAIDFTRIACPNGCHPPDYCNRCYPDGGTPTGTFDALATGDLHQIIVGGESGPNARPMHPAWPRDIRDQCASAGVAYLFKQHGAWIGVPDLRRLPGGTGPGFGVFDHCRHDMEADAVRVGKKAAGRLLDGRTWDEMPEVRHG